MLLKTLPQIVQDNVTDELQGTVSDIGKPSNYIVLYISMYTRTNHNHHNDACAQAAVAPPPPPPANSQSAKDVMATSAQTAAVLISMSSCHRSVLHV